MHQITDTRAKQQLSHQLTLPERKNIALANVGSSRKSRWV